MMKKPATARWTHGFLLFASTTRHARAFAVPSITRSFTRLWASKDLSYNDWIREAQAGRNADWEWNVGFAQANDTATAPPFPHNTLFHHGAEEYARNHTTVASDNVQTAARITQEEKLFAPCMVGTLESQFLKMMARTKQAKTILDVGTFTGMSAIAFAEGALAVNDRVVVDTLESDGPTARVAQTIFDQCEDRVRESIRLHHTDALGWMQRCEGRTYDIVFLDADKENYLAYYELVMERSLLAEEGMILADNTLSALVYDEDDYRRVALHKFNQAIKKDDRVQHVVLTVREGITMITRRD